MKLVLLLIDTQGPQPGPALYPIEVKEEFIELVRYCHDKRLQQADDKVAIDRLYELLGKEGGPFPEKLGTLIPNSEVIKAKEVVWFWYD